MKRCNLIFFGLLLLCGCKNEKPEVLRETAVPQFLNSDIMTTMPGDLIVTDRHLVWEDPFARDYFVHVHDKDSGKEIGTMGKVGEGPEEFVTGGISPYCIDNRFFATDANGKTKGYLSIDSLLQQKETFVPLTEIEESHRPSFSELEKGVFVGKTKDGNASYFTAIINGTQSDFGIYPVREVKQHVGDYQAYDAHSGLLAYSSFQFPYLALYQKEGNTFKMLWENKPKNPNYEIIEDRLVFDRKEGGLFGLCMSKDYIIALQRDRENDPMDESTVGRNVAKCPRTVFLYDYDSHLVKIVDLQMPVMRIAADRKSNMLYVIGANPDYVLAKYEL